MDIMGMLLRRASWVYTEFRFLARKQILSEVKIR